MSGGPWYAEGLRFECTMCGACCSGPPGYVLFTEDEARAMAGKLGVSVEEFVARFTREMDVPLDGRRRRSLREVETEHGLDCVFLDRSSVAGKAVCVLHEVRPMQCRTFPFWPEHVRTPATWRELGRVCEGVDRGPVHGLAQITVSVEAQRGSR
ncbi:MAG: YkgJ family cysteine cluster protein [Planctomycetota bacterium]|nr:YkgJ family cysteine cluster protein [Planctomycetota bacterium]